MGNPSPRYTAEFKQRAVGLYRKSGTTYAEVTRGLGCDAGSLSDWVRKADAAGPAPDANPFQTAEDLRRLKRENAKISCARKLFNKINNSDTRYDSVDSYEKMLQIIGGLE